MSSPDTQAVVTLGDVSLSAHDLCRRLHQRRRLVPLLRKAVVEEFLLFQAKQAGLSVSNEELQQAADRFRQRHGLSGAEPTQQWLARESLSVEDFEAGLERDLLIEKLKEHLTHERIAGHFSAHRDRYARARLRQIVVASEGQARELLAQLTDEGAAFADLASRHAGDGPARQTGASHVVQRHALPGAVAAAIFAARPGGVVGPLATPQGFCLFLVEELLPPELDAETTAAIRRELFDAWLGDRLREVQIDLAWLESA
jgi:parvulin-like peptidyl-prolyl isomerase